VVVSEVDVCVVVVLEALHVGDITVYVDSVLVAVV
jgi:hypothetical protein